jgi:sugar lactone lactonase YvrE
MATPTRLLERDDGLTVDIVEYPLPDHDGNPWSQWGQGVVAANGALYSAVGDHLGTDGNSYFYAYDPTAETLTRFADVLSLVDHRAGDFGYGKVHAQMVAGACGEVYAHTYWGTRRGLEYDDSYRGDLLLRIDPGFVELLGVTAEGRGTPSMAASADRRLLYLEAVDPESDESELVVYDVVGREALASMSDPHAGNRALAVDATDRVYFSSGDSRLSVYDPATNKVEEIDARMPGKILRAATAVRSDGSLIGVTDNPDEFFVLDADGSLRDLGRAAGYTASLAMSADGRRVYYVPGAHGNSWELGTPVIEVDTATGQQTNLVELHDLVQDSLGVRLGGSYNVVMDPTGQRLYAGLNAGEDGESFGRVFLVIIVLP